MNQRSTFAALPLLLLSFSLSQATQLMDYNLGGGPGQSTSQSTGQSTEEPTAATGSQEK